MDTYISISDIARVLGISRQAVLKQLQEEIKTGEIEAKTEGNEIELAFKSRFLLDYLNVHKGTVLELIANDPTSAVKFLTDDHKDYLHVVMPMARN